MVPLSGNIEVWDAEEEHAFDLRTKQHKAMQRIQEDMVDTLNGAIAGVDGDAFIGLAREVLDELGYYNVAIKVGDGTLGWREHAPYDAVIVTAGAPEIPRPLVEQLKDGGRMVIPVGDTHTQNMIIGQKIGGELETRDIGPYRFVDLVGMHGWKE